MSINVWSSVIGSMPGWATGININSSFEPIVKDNTIISLDDAIIHDLFADQFYGYKVVCAIRNAPK